MKVGLHHGSVLGHLLSVNATDVVMKQTRNGLPWDLLYADDLVLMVTIRDEMGRKGVEGRTGVLVK